MNDSNIQVTMKEETEDEIIEPTCSLAWKHLSFPRCDPAPVLMQMWKVTNKKTGEWTVEWRKVETVWENG